MLQSWQVQGVTICTVEEKNAYPRHLTLTHLCNGQQPTINTNEHTLSQTNNQPLTPMNTPFLKPTTNH